jgi:hypothetical protein
MSSSVAILSDRRPADRTRRKVVRPDEAIFIRAAGDDVTEGIVRDSDHWIMEENSQATIKRVRDFIVR